MGTVHARRIGQSLAVFTHFLVYLVFLPVNLMKMMKALNCHQQGHGVGVHLKNSNLKSVCFPAFTCLCKFVFVLSITLTNLSHPEVRESVSCDLKWETAN